MWPVPIPHITHTHVAHTYTQGTRNAAGGIVHPLTPAPHQTQIIPPSPIPHTRAAARAALAVQEPLTLAGTTLKFIDTPWVGTHAPTPEADISSAIVNVGKGPSSPHLQVELRNSTRRPDSSLFVFNDTQAAAQAIEGPTGRAPAVKPGRTTQA